MLNSKAVHLVKCVPISGERDAHPPEYEPRIEKKTKHELQPLMLIDLKDDTLGDVFSQSGKCS